MLIQDIERMVLMVILINYFLYIPCFSVQEDFYTTDNSVGDYVSFSNSIKGNA